MGACLTIVQSKLGLVYAYSRFKSTISPARVKPKACYSLPLKIQNPILFFEHKGLYRSISEEVPTDYYTLPIGKRVWWQKEKTSRSITTVWSALGQISSRRMECFRDILIENALTH